jgi:hypothetical protein
MIGNTIAHYRIIAAIGAGGIGEVHRATDTKLGTQGASRRDGDGQNYSGRGYTLIFSTRFQLFGSWLGHRL